MSEDTQPPPVQKFDFAKWQSERILKRALAADMRAHPNRYPRDSPLRRRIVAAMGDHSIFWLSKRAKVPYTSIYNYLSGKSASMRSDSLERVLRAVRIEMKDKNQAGEQVNNFSNKDH